MPLTIVAWNLLDGWEKGAARQVGSVRAKLGSTSRVEELLRDGHLRRSGQKLVRTQASIDAFTLFAQLPKEDRGISNARARASSGLSERAYDRAKRLLLATGEAAAGRGRGGSLRRAAGVIESGRADGVAREDELYEPFLRYLKVDEGSGDCAFREDRITGHGGGLRQATGQWSRPDLVSVEVSDLPFLPDRQVTVRTYELKPLKHAYDLLGVYEASAHQRRSHYTTLVVEYPDDEDLSRLEKVEAECQRLGVGLSRMWGSRVSPILASQRHAPEPRELNEFLRDVVPEERRDEYLTAIGKPPGRLLEV